MLQKKGDRPVCISARCVIFHVCAASKQLKTMYIVGLHVELLSDLHLFLSSFHFSIEQNKVCGVQKMVAAPQNKQKMGRNAVATGNQSIQSIFRPSFRFRAFAKIRTMLSEEAKPPLTLVPRVPPPPHWTLRCCCVNGAHNLGFMPMWLRFC